MSQDDDDSFEDESNDVERRPAKTSGKAIASLIFGISSIVCAIITGLPAIVFGILSLMDISKSRGRLTGQGLAIGGIVTGVLGIVLIGPAIMIAMLVPAVQKVRNTANRIKTQCNLKQIGLALYDFADRNGRLPLAYTSSPDGKPLLSWRVHILPYLGEEVLYEQFKLDEPWDSPTNLALLKAKPRVFDSPDLEIDEILKGKTRFRVFVGPGTALDKSGDSPAKGPPRGARIPADFPDGLSQTLLVTEAVEAVEWTKPEGLPLDAPA